MRPTMDDTPVARPESRPTPSSNVPFRRDPYFAGRADVIAQITAALEAPAARVALTGLGGVGKSHIAIEYCYSVREKSPDTWVFWIHASSEARYRQSVRDAAALAQVPGHQNPGADIYGLLCDWLRYAQDEPWLIVLDNADEVDFMLTRDRTGSRLLIETFPICDHGRMLITSRSEVAALRMVEDGYTIAVAPMQEKDAVELLEGKIGRQEDYMPLAAALDYMPLAITHAAAYVRDRGAPCSVTEYLEQLRKRDTPEYNILNACIGDLRGDSVSSNSILLTWQISFEHMRRDFPSAAARLSLMSFCNPDSIPEMLILRFRSEDDEENPEAFLDFQLEQGIRMLRRFGFVSETADGWMVGMHRRVQLATQRWLQARGRTDHWIDVFMRNLDKALVIERFGFWDKHRLLYPHARAAMVLQPKDQNTLLLKASICYKAGWYAREQGLATESEEFRYLAQDIQKAVLGADHPDTLASMASLAATLFEQGRWDEAERLQVTVLKKRESLRDKAENPSPLEIISLAAQLLERGRGSEVERLRGMVPKTTQRMLREKRSNMLISMASRAATYSKQGRWTEAEQVQVQVLERRKRVLGEELSDTLMSTHDLAETYRYQGRWSEAQRLEHHLEEDDDTASVVSHQSLQSVFSIGSIASPVSSVNEPFISGMEKFVQLSAQRRDLAPLLTLATATVSKEKFLRNNARLLKALSKEASSSDTSPGARLAGRVLRDKRKRLEISRRLFARYCSDETFQQDKHVEERRGPEKIEPEVVLAQPPPDDPVPQQPPQLQAEPDSDVAGSDSSRESSVDSADEADDEHDDPYGLTDFVLNSDIFSCYVRDLWLFLNPVTPQLLIKTMGLGDFQRVRELLDNALNSKVKARPDWLEELVDLDLDTGQDPQLFAQTVLLKLHEPYARRVAGALTSATQLEGTAALMRDLAWVPPERVRISAQEDLGVGDLVKERVERVTGASWDWWPLALPKKRIPAGYSRVKWNTPNGHPRSIDISNADSDVLRQALRTAPPFLSASDVLSGKDHRPNTVSAHGSNDGGNPPGDTASQGRQQTSPSRQQPAQQTSLGSRAIQQGAPHTVSYPQVSNSISMVPLRDPRYLYLCLRSGSIKHKVLEFSLSDLESDEAFFHAMQQKYTQSRGMTTRWLGWASWWRFDHCEFWSFQKYKDGVAFSTKSVPIGVSFPSETDANYDFTPRPIDLAPPEGPITNLEFNERFYSCCERAHRWQHQQRRYLIPTPGDTDAVSMLPKRTAALEMQDGKREKYWGLLVKERRSDLVVLIYVVLFNFPGLVFFFLWLFPWGHAADLQNASVPALTTLSLTVGLVGWLYNSPGSHVR